MSFLPFFARRCVRARVSCPKNVKNKQAAKVACRNL
jgi:hypothetical protein